jgi:hypothetical protein
MSRTFPLNDRMVTWRRHSAVNSGLASFIKGN